MPTLVAFAACFLVAVLVSERARRTVLSTAVLFLLAGFVLGEGMLAFVPVTSDDPAASQFAELALFSVLFTDGMRVGARELTSAWRLPGRALLLGFPLSLLATAAAGVFVAGLPWSEALLLGAVLAPTDPVFASAIVGREEVPGELRHLLNVESGLNDGLALPVVLVLLDVLGAGEVGVVSLASELVLGAALGVAIPWAAIRLERSRFFATSSEYEPLFGVAIGLLVLGLASVTHANLFLAAFAAGVTVATMSEPLVLSFRELGESVAEILKLAALLVLGALISPSFLAEIPLTGYLFALIVLLLVRPVSLGIALLGSHLDRRLLVAAAWFGPKGFASVVYALIVLHEGLPRGEELFHLAALVVAASIVAHSSTDVVVAKKLTGSHAEERSPAPGPTTPPERPLSRSPRRRR